MKRIKLQSIIQPDAGSVFTAAKSYRVHLGNRRGVSFSSAREAKAFQAATERMLEDVLHEANLHLGHAYMAYRMAWPALHHKGRPLTAHEAQLRECLQWASEALDRLASGFDGPNRMTWAWKYLTDACSALAEFHEVLGKWYQYKTQGVQRHQARIAQRHCQDLVQRLRDYGAKDQQSQG